MDLAQAESREEALADEQKNEKYQEYTNPAKVPMAGYTQDNGKEIKGIEDYIPRSQYNGNIKHHNGVVKDIKENWERLSQGGKFHALLATASIAEAIEYYKLLREAMPELHVTALFDPAIDKNEDDTAYKEDAIADIITDYNSMFGTNYTLATHSSFKADISLRLAHKSTFCNIAKEQQLNLLIVVKQMLTGYDSKWINTLYIDKMMEYADIIQAISRTNRLFGLDKPFGVIRYYRYPHTMQQNIDKAVKLYSAGKPVKLIADPLLYNLRQMNRNYEEIADLFAKDKIVHFAVLPSDVAVRGRFAKLFRELHAHLEAARIQGFRWDKTEYRLEDENKREVTITMSFDEQTYKTLLARYKELSHSGGGGGSEEVPYDIDTYLTELDTGVIDTNYLNSRYEKYLRTLNTGSATEEERTAVLEELHKSFATLTEEDQCFAHSFLHDAQMGKVKVDSGKSFYDYVVEYKTNAHNDTLKKMADRFGLNENMLRELMNTKVDARNINENGRFDKLLKSANPEKAKAYFEQKEGKVLKTFEVNRNLDNELRKLILENN